MPNFENAIIYKIYSSMPEYANHIYIGSTTSSMNNRLNTHKQMINKGNNSKFYQFFRDKVDTMVLEILERLEDCECKAQLYEREKHYIDQYNNNPECTLLNSYKFNFMIAGVINKTEQRKYNNKYYKDKNYMVLLRKVKCDICDKEVSRCNMQKHLQSKKHIKKYHEHRQIMGYDNNEDDVLRDAINQIDENDDIDENEEN